MCNSSRRCAIWQMSLLSLPPYHPLAISPHTNVTWLQHTGAAAINRQLSQPIELAHLMAKFNFSGSPKTPYLNHP